MKHKSFNSASYLRQVLTIYAAIALFVLAFIVSLFIIGIMYTYLQDDEEKNIRHAVEIRSMAVSEWVRRAQDLTWQITSRTRMREELVRYNQGEISLAQLTDFTEPKLADATNLSAEIIGATRLDLQGHPIAIDGVPVPFIDSIDTQADTIAISKPFDTDGGQGIVVSAPILTRDGERVGTDLVVFDLSSLQNIAIPGQSTNDIGDVIIGYTANNQFLSLFSHQSFEPVTESSLQKSLTGQTGMTRLDRNIIAYAPVANSPWGIVLTQDRQEFYAQLYSQLLLIGIASVLAYGAFAFGFWVMTKPLAGRLLLHTTELEQEVHRKTIALQEEIASRKKIEESLRANNNLLNNTLSELKQAQTKTMQQERLAAVGQLAAGVAHDFNNILTGILGFTELLIASPDVPNTLTPTLQQISKGGRRAARLVRQLLDFSRKSITRSRPINLVTVLQESVEFLGRTIPETIQVTLNITPGNYAIIGDPTQLHEVITNLAINAKDAMPEGGRLIIKLSHVTMTDEKFCATCHQPITGNWIVCSMTDTGSGIPTDVLPHVFEPFYTTKDEFGTGLGLAQVYGIVSQHGGHITVETEPEHGTCISIYLPTTPQSNAAILPQQPPAQIGQGQIVLLVEDEVSVLEVMRAMLKKLGYYVLTATSGEEALEIYRANHTDITLVISDITMPAMSGEALLHTLALEYHTLKMILMTGYPFHQKPDMSSNPNLVGWLQKPISLSDLSQVLDAGLSDKQPRQHNGHKEVII